MISVESFQQPFGSRELIIGLEIILGIINQTFSIKLLYKYHVPSTHPGGFKV